ncbi:TLC domain-containing protein [Massariosphaeria phaeospora]|uniref:TLC domain-containing protein n=1 Tax=Massariosphaeria phaeospora TaxID=100035 RepID=A0A7C8HYP1_9PLEO|nr:TLC domain-containing protein [Massariosphaeria phaeospora]
MASSDTEPFPPLVGHIPHRENHMGGYTTTTTTTANTNTRRRNSSALGGELPGDSDVAAFATFNDNANGHKIASPPSTPTEASPSPSRPARRSKRRTIPRAFSKWKRLCYRHTWLFPLVLALTIISLYLVNPVPSNPISAALFLSYPLPHAAGSSDPVHYGKGARDFAFVGFYIIVLSFMREFLMQRLIRPIAIHYGIKSRAKQNRFMEQFYTALYFGVLGPFGMWVMSRTPVWYFSTTGMYVGFPHKTHDAYFKAYYLLQAAYWAQQMIVLLLMLEKPRKDFRELVGHHFITLALIWLSYRFHFTYMGIAIYITMDISDFFLASSKILNYLDAPIVTPYFTVFMFIWGYLRHYVNLKIMYSILTEFSTVGPFELNWETEQYKCWLSQYIAFALLAALQAVNMFWGFLILRIAYRIAFLNILVNGEVPATPKRTTGTEDQGSVSSRLRERKKSPS